MIVMASQYNYDFEQQLRGLLLGDAHLLLKGDLFLTSRRFPPEDLDVLRVQESFQGTDTQRLSLIEISNREETSTIFIRIF